MGKEADGDPPSDQIMVNVPLDFYLRALSAEIPREVRTKTQVYADMITRLVGETPAQLAHMYDPDQRELERTAARCQSLQDRIMYVVTHYEQFTKGWVGVAEAIKPFTEGVTHYRHAYDPDFRRTVTTWARGGGEGGVYRGKNWGISWDKMHRVPEIGEYEADLSPITRPLFPLYVATHFIPRPFLPMPPGIESAFLAS